MAEEKRDACPKTYLFSLVVVRRPSDGKFLAVNESRGRGWWLPGGHVDAGEQFEAAAIRETLEEGGINVKLTGILRVEFSTMGTTMARQRVLYLAEPVDEAIDTGKDFADDESEEAKFLSLSEIQALPHHRGPELLEWCEYVHGGGAVAPLSFFTKEGAPPPSTT